MDIGKVLELLLNLRHCNFVTTNHPVASKCEQWVKYVEEVQEFLIAEMKVDRIDHEERNRNFGTRA